MARPPELGPQATVESARKNIDTVVRLEQASMESRSLGERVSDLFTRFMGTMSFVVCHLLLFAVWFVVNLGWTPLKPFDPFPFGILTLIVSAEGVLLAIFVLVSQNRMSRQANQRAHLDLQVSMLAEQEMTLMLQMQHRMAEHLGVPPLEDEPDANRLMQKTDVQEIV